MRRLGELRRRRVPRGVDEPVLAVGPRIRPVVPVAPVSRLAVFQERLVGPVPDAAARERAIGAEDLPVAAEIAERIAHRVRVFAEEERLARGLPRKTGGLRQSRASALAHLAALAERRDGHVHRAVEIGQPVPLLIEDRARRVSRAHGGSRLREAGPAARLVAERPHHDARMVRIIRDLPHVARDDRRLPLRPPADALALILPETVRLDVRLGDHVEPVAVAQAVPARVVRIVRRADGVEVRALHQEDVLEHFLLRHRRAVPKRELVPVDAVELDRAPIDEQTPTLCLDLTESHARRAALRAAVERQRVEVRVFRRPRPRARHGKDECRATVVLPHDDTAVGRRERRRHGHARRHRERPVAIRGVSGARRRAEVADRAGERLGEQRHAPCDPRQADHVLVFEIAAVAPPEHADAKEVVLELDARRDVEFGRKLRVLGIADMAAVDPDVESGRDTLETQDDALSAPGLRHAERPPIEGDGILLRLDARRRLRERVASAHVARHAITGQLDAARHVYFRPGRIVVVRAKKVAWREGERPRPVERPGAVYREDALAIRE